MHSSTSLKSGPIQGVTHFFCLELQKKMGNRGGFDIIVAFLAQKKREREQISCSLYRIVDRFKSLLHYTTVHTIIQQDIYTLSLVCTLKPQWF